MTQRTRLSLFAALGLLAALSSLAVRAECGGSVQCIGVGPTRDAALLANHGLGPDTFTLSFTRQALGSTSASQTIFVEAVAGAPAGSMAKLGAITITGAGAGDFLISGGTCSTTVGPVHGGNGCTVLVAFRPTSLGEKTATVRVPLDPPCAGCITERIVTVTGTVGRADPSTDSRVKGVLSAQADAAWRFSQAQIANAGRRLESLHPRGAGGTRAGATGTPAANALASAATSGNMDVGALTPSSGAGHFWLGGIASFGDSAARDGQPGFDFRTSGLSVGVDRAFGRDLVAGVALGAAHDRTQIGTDGTRSRARGVSAMAYASFAPAPGFFVDGLVGGGSLDFRSSRSLAPLNGFAEADRGGRQFFGSLATGYEWVDKGLLVSPYARADFSRERLDGAVESGPEGTSLAYAKQRASSWQGALGVRAESIRQTDFGRMVPRARLEVRRAYRTVDDASITYADLPQDPPFLLATPDVRRNAVLLGLGADFILRGGLTFGIDYRLQRESARESNQSILFSVSQALDGRGAPGWSWLLPSRQYAIQVDAGYGRDDNVGRSRDGDSKFSDDFFGARVRLSDAYPIGKQSRAVLAATLGGDKFRTYNGLSRATAGLEGEFQYRTSAAFSAPTLALFAQAATQQFESRQRDGQRYALGASMQSLLTDRIGLFASLSRNRTDADGTVFDASDNAAKINMDYSIAPGKSFYLTGEYRRGDVVFATTPSVFFVNKDEGPFLYPGGGIQDDVFPSPLLVNYRIDGRTASVMLGYNLALGPRESLDLSWRRVRSSPTDATDLPAVIFEKIGSPRYTVNQIFVFYLLSF